MLIAGDIGGTTTRLALVSAEAGPRKLLVEENYRSADYKGLQPIVEAFLASHRRSGDLRLFRRGGAGAGWAGASDQPAMGPGRS